MAMIRSSTTPWDDEREAQRLATIAMLGILDTPPEREFDVLVGLAQRMLHCKIALVSVIDADRQWFKSQCGLDVSETPREHSFCDHAVRSGEPLVIADATADARFASNPLVAGPPSIRFYAGVPIRARVTFGEPASIAIGTLCVIDDSPRRLGENGLKTLLDLADLVEALIDARAAAVHANRLARERQAYIHRLNREQTQFKQAERMANIGSWRLTLADNQVAWSDQVFAIHELPAGVNPPLERALDFYPPHAQAVISAALARTIETGQPFDVETDFTTDKGNYRRVRSMGEVERVEGAPVALIGLFQDVTVHFQMEQSLRRRADIDDLTQLPNRARCNQFIDDAIVKAVERQDDLALLLIDLDGFKLVNDRCGHLAGDDLLRLVGARLQSPYLSTCFAARIGGDEFVLVVSKPHDCVNLGAIVRHLLADLCQTVESSDGVVQVSGTIGISWLDPAARSRRELLRRADLALYMAKQERRGSARVFGDADIFPRKAATG